jgi:hypothetical protein
MQNIRGEKQAEGYRGIMKERKNERLLLSRRERESNGLVGKVGL